MLSRSLECASFCRSIHVIPSIAEEASGPTYSVVRLCESLAAAGQVVTLASLAFAPVATPPNFARLFPTGLGPRRLGRSPAMYRWMKTECRSGNVDIVHNHGMWQMNAAYPAWISTSSNVRAVYSPRGALSSWAMSYGSRTKRVFWPLFQRPALRKADCFHATSLAEYEDIRRLGFNQPVAIIPNGIDTEALPKKRIGARRTLLFLGRLHRVKGLDVLIRAWREVQYQFPDWQLGIVGSDESHYGASGYRSELEMLVQELNASRVEFLGPRYGDEKKQQYRDADLFVLPSHSENFGVAVAEALAMETPAVVSRNAPWSGLLERGAGWWVESGVDSLASCLRTALSCTPVDLAEKGRQGRRWMVEEFSWGSIGERMADTYAWLCGRSSSVPEWVRLD